MQVGFIGLGDMGLAMADNLRRAGHDLTVYNRTRARQRALGGAGRHHAEGGGRRRGGGPRGHSTISHRLTRRLAVEGCRPLFDAMGQGTDVVGDDAVRAAVVKIAGNFLLVAAIEAIGEAYALVRTHGAATPFPIASLARGRYPAAVARGWCDLDWAALARVSAVAAGLEGPIANPDAAR